MEFLDLNTSSIINQAIQNLNNSTNLTFLSPGSKVRAIIDILGEEVATQAINFDKNINASLLRNASGITLDYLGEIFGLTRLKEARAEIGSQESNMLLYTEDINFGALNGNQPIVIPANKMKISNQEDNSSTAIFYTNAEQVILYPNENRKYFSAKALNAGSSSNVGANSLVFHDFVGYEDFSKRTLLVTNTQSIVYGRNTEPDDNFRYRIQKEKLSGEAGNQTSLRLALLSIPGVSDVVRTPYTRGIGTSDWLIKSSSTIANNDLLNLCQLVLNLRQSEGTSNMAKSPVLIGVEMAFSLTYKMKTSASDKEKIKTQIKKNITDYINNLAIGENLIIDQIVKIVLSSSDMVESMGDPDSVDNFKNIYIYKRSSLSNALSRKSLLKDYKTKADERVVIEPTISSPITIIDNN